MSAEARGTQQQTTRRRFLGALGGAAGLVGLGALEVSNLRGAFDHRAEHVDEHTQLSATWNAELDPHRSALVHIGHSTHLLQLGALRVLTDPWFFDPGHGGMWHAHGPALSASKLGALDLIVITHEHPDHADPKALDRMDKRALVVVPTRELLQTVRALGYSQVEWLAPWKELTHRDVKLTAVPAVHDVYEISYVIEAANQRVYFAGDTALHEDMPAIAERFTPTVAILPVDGTRLITSERLVMNPEDAVRATRLLSPQMVVPSHADGRFAEPVLSMLATQVDNAAQRFSQALASTLPTVHCALPAIGQRVLLPQR